jgi:diadenosine tetraphosphate (Ap4A) HIT family hydrolase
LSQSPFFDRQFWINENDSAFVLRDRYPVSKGHTLVVPKRAVTSFFELTEREIVDCWRLLELEKKKLEDELSPDGFNIGINDGEAAGQTILHAHMHLIPRYRGDCPNPRGGVRGVIPGKADYTGDP